MKKILLGIITCFVCVGVLVSVAIVSTACKKKKSLVLEPEIMSAEDIESAKHFTFAKKTIDGVEGYKVVSYKGGLDDNCVIPETYKGLDVLEIEDYLFYKYEYDKLGRILSVTLSSKLLVIGSCSFRECTGFTEIVIPNSVTTIEYSAFSGCSGLTEIVIGSLLVEIGDYAFSSCQKLVHVTNLSSATIESNTFNASNIGYEYRTSIDTAWINTLSTDGNGYITYVVNNAGINNGTYFMGYVGSESEIEIPDSCTEIYGYSLYENMIVTKLTIPNSITTIEKEHFHGCSGLGSIVIEPGNSKYDSRDNCNAIIETSTNTLVFGCKNSTIPNTIITIGDNAFDKCSGLTGFLTIPNSVITIGDYAFYECVGLTGIIIGNTVSTIGYAAFSGCKGLTGTLNIPNSVTTIGGNAFWYCSELTGTLTIPNSVTTMGGSAFSGCGGLTEIIVESGNSKYDSRNDCNAIIETETNTLIFGCKNTTISNTVTKIGKNAFTGCTLLAVIIIPDSVTEIENSAFSGCTGLTSVIIPNSVTIIGASAFIGCDINSIVIGSAVTTIGNSAFFGCLELNTVIIDSETIANQLTNFSSDGGILSYCKSLYLKNGITASGFIKSEYSVRYSDKIGYTKYVK